ncbi:hypothetical protein ACFSTH_02870 [Paenibacillus yanchengensis]|uniref:Uncharacterized protein n=1 Tax=Paenibacillus yanchengensis TaxID=2035833 RepID=A0ABW4YGA4_9BACL
MRILLQPRSRNWLLYLPITTAVITIMIYLVRFVMAGATFDVVIALRMLLFSFIVASIYSLLGYFGLRYILLLSKLGLLLGLVMMSILSQGNATGWEDLAGFIAFLFLFGAGFVVGIVVELIRIIYVYIKQKKQ